MFNWKDNYSVGIRSIDDQHKELLRIGKEIYSITRSPKGVDYYDDLVLLLQKLQSYAKEHFKYEEKLLSQHSYEGLEQHSKEHEKFIDSLLEVGKMDIDKLQDVVLTKLLLFVADWIEGHILKVDMDYSSFLTNKGVN